MATNGFGSMDFGPALGSGLEAEDDGYLDLNNFQDAYDQCICGYIKADEDEFGTTISDIGGPCRISCKGFGCMSSPEMN